MTGDIVARQNDCQTASQHTILIELHCLHRVLNLFSLRFVTSPLLASQVVNVKVLLLLCAGCVLVEQTLESERT